MSSINSYHGQLISFKCTTKSILCNLQVYEINNGKSAMRGWVMLSMTWLELTTNSLRARLDTIYPGQFLPPRERGTFVLEGPAMGMQFVIQSAIEGAQSMFMVNSVPGPYADVSDFATHIEDRQLRDLASAQKAWLSVELIHQTARPRDAERFIGRVLADLAPTDTAFLVHPSRLTCRRFDDGVRRKLANGAQFD